MAQDGPTPDTIPSPSTASESDGRTSRYPRRGLMRHLQALALTAGWGIVLSDLYIVATDPRLRRSALAALHQLFANGGRLDQGAAWFAIDAAILLVGLAGAVWATRDAWAEEVVARERRRLLRAELAVPFEVRAERRWREALAAARACGDRRAEGEALGNVGFFLLRQERPAEAEEYLTQGLALAREQGERFREERDLHGLAEVAEAAGDLDRAESLYRESLAVARLIADTAVAEEEVADGNAVLGEFLIVARGRRDEGRRLLEEAERGYRAFVKFGRYRAKRVRGLLRQYADESRRSRPDQEVV